MIRAAHDFPPTLDHLDFIENVLVEYRSFHKSKRRSQEEVDPLQFHIIQLCGTDLPSTTISGTARRRASMRIWSPASRSSSKSKMASSPRKRGAAIFQVISGAAGCLLSYSSPPTSCTMAAGGSTDIAPGSMAALESSSIIAGCSIVGRILLLPL